MTKYSEQGEALITRATAYLRGRYSEWLVHPKQGPGLFWLDSGAQKACYVLYGLWPTIKREG